MLRENLQLHIMTSESYHQGWDIPKYTEFSRLIDHTIEAIPAIDHLPQTHFSFQYYPPPLHQ